VKTPMLIYLYYFFQEINSHRGFMNKQKFSKKFVISGALCILIVMMILRIFEIQQLIHVSIRPLKYMIPRLKNSICIIIQQEQFFSVHTSYGYCVSQFGRRPLETFWIDSTLTQLHFYVIVSRWQVSISNPRNLTQNWYCSSWVEGSRLQLLEEFRGGSAIPDRIWNHCLGLKREKNFGPTAKLFWDLYRTCHLHATMLVNALDLCHITQNPTANTPPHRKP